MGSVIVAGTSADPQAWSQVEPAHRPWRLPRYDTTIKFEGNNSGKFDRQAADLASYLRVNDFNQAHDLYGRLYFRFAGIPDPSGTRIVDVVGGYNNGDSNSHSITLTGLSAGVSAGRINMKAGGAVGIEGDTDLLMTAVPHR